MAAGHVWGIDIGQCGLKALRGRMADDGQSVIAEAFDYVEYPQILSQPDANPDQLVRDALKTFLSRNTLRGDKVAISLPGQSGLARFIKLPPADPKQLPALVGFEAKQQIPFALEDVVWDYQRIAAGETVGDEDDEDDLPAETEVGLFAIKRDQVLRSIRPLVDAEVELDYVQLAPMSVYNAMAYDLLQFDNPAADNDPNNWLAILSMGTDASDLVITNGHRVWQRSVPIGGNHFTKQLTKDLKLTFAKAELLKRNAREAKDAKQIFQAMRSVFNDLVTEVQRSIGYFGSLERSAEISRLVVLGNAVKLPGLPQYLEKNLGISVAKLDDYLRLSGAGVTDDNGFQENLLSFPVTYGLVLQGLGKGAMQTNLVPPEIVRARIIRRKKPWAAAIAASLMLACAFNFFFNYRAWASVTPDRTVNNQTWDSAKNKLQQVNSTHSNFVSADQQKVETLKRLEGLGEETVGSDDGRKLWIELLKAITDCLPTDQVNPDALKTPLEHPLSDRPNIYIDSIESQFFADLNEWKNSGVDEKYQAFLTERREDLAEEQARQLPPDSEDGEPVDGQPLPEVDEPEEVSLADDSGQASGWVIEITGHHFKRSGAIKDARYVRKTLLEQLYNGTVRLPVGPDGPIEEFTVQELGIAFPVLVEHQPDRNFKIKNQDYQPPRSEQTQPSAEASIFQRPTNAQPEEAEEDPNNPQFFSVERYTFKVAFAWKQVPLKQRLKARKLKEQAAQAEGAF